MYAMYVFYVKNASYVYPYMFSSKPAPKGSNLPLFLLVFFSPSLLLYKKNILIIERKRRRNRGKEIVIGIVREIVEETPPLGNTFQNIYRG